MAGFANDFSTTLNAGITSGVTALTVTTDKPSALTVPFYIRIDDELLKVTATSGAGNRDWTVTRAAEEATRFPAASHSAGATVEQVVTASLLNDIPESGTAFPASPSTYDRFFRTDLALDFYYDGTRWLTTQVFERTVPTAEGITATATFARLSSDSALDLWILDIRITTRISTATNDASNYWTIAAAKISPTNAGTNFGTFTTVADGAAPTNWLEHSITVNDSVASASFPLITFSATKTLSAGTLFAVPLLRYRLIGT